MLAKALNTATCTRSRYLRLCRIPLANTRRYVINSSNEAKFCNHKVVAAEAVTDVIWPGSNCGSETSESAVKTLSHMFAGAGEHIRMDLRLSPLWDPLRNDPRFQKLCAEPNK